MGRNGGSGPLTFDLLPLGDSVLGGGEFPSLGIMHGGPPQLVPGEAGTQRRDRERGGEEGHWLLTQSPLEAGSMLGLPVPRVPLRDQALHHSPARDLSTDTRSLGQSASRLCQSPWRQKRGELAMTVPFTRKIMPIYFDVTRKVKAGVYLFCPKQRLFSLAITERDQEMDCALS